MISKMSVAFGKSNVIVASRFLFYFTGYYRVNYDTDTWSAIANILHKSHSSVNVLNRAQVN